MDISLTQNEKDQSILKSSFDVGNEEVTYELQWLKNEEELKADLVIETIEQRLPYVFVKVSAFGGDQVVGEDMNWELNGMGETLASGQESFEQINPTNPETLRIDIGKYLQPGEEFS